MQRSRERSPRARGDQRSADPDAGRTRGGEPLAASLRARMESRFAHDFADVRVHDDAPSHDAASGWGAAAFTTGSDIFLAEGQGAADEDAGHYLLAHELAHVVQNERASGQRGPASLGSVSAAGDAAEAEASAAAETVWAGGSPRVAASPSAVVARATAIPPWLETIRRNAIGDTGPAPAPSTPTGLQGPRENVGVNKAGGVTIDSSGIGFRHDAGSIETNSFQGQLGAWDEGDSTRYGFKAGGGLAKAALNENYIGELIGDPTLVVGADIGVGTANAEASLNPDTGLALGAQYNAIEASISGGRKDPKSDTDEWARFGMSLGGGAGVRAHWGDEDKDGTRSYGFGADFGPLSFDVKTEDPMRTAMRLGGGGGVADALGSQNLTKQTGEALGNYWDQVGNVVQQIPANPLSGVIPGLDAVQAMGLPDISLPSFEDILSFF